MGVIYKNGISYAGGGSGGGGTAEEIEYESNTWVESDNVQDAIDEVAGTKITKAEFDALPESVRNTGVYIVTDEELDPSSERIDAVESRLDTVEGEMANAVFHTEAISTASDTPRDADTLAGQQPSYYATQASVDEVNTNLALFGNKFIRVTGTTDDAGNVSLFSNDGNLVVSTSELNNHMAIPFLYDGIWFAKVFDVGSTMAIIANTNVTIDILYIGNAH